MEPWQSWTAVLLGGGAIWYYYNSQANAKAKRGRAVVGRAGPSAHKADSTSKKGDGNKAKRSKDDTKGLDVSGDDQKVGPVAESSAVSASEKGKGKKRRNKTPQPVSSPRPDDKDMIAGADEPEEALDNKEFARQLSGLKTGTTLAPPSKTGPRHKTVKTSTINGAAAHQSASDANNRASTASSTAGADADDDLSPAHSPALGATKINNRSGVDVSDMLEAPQPGPQVLRVVPSNEPPRVQKPKAQKVHQPEETKKQRQNRRKAEERKAAREADEQARRVLLEKQLRTAREAEGRPAKNGLGSTSKAPATSAWAAPTGPVTGVPAQAVGVEPLLDTFDPAKFNGTNSTPSGVTGGKHWERDLPSEEEQMRMISESTDAGWSTVSGGKKGRKKAAATNGSTTGNESSENGDASNTMATSYATAAVFTPQLADSDWSVV
jgi:hypothetical protein